MNLTWSDFVWASIVAGLLFQVIRNGRQLRRLTQWAGEALDTPVPDASGRWGDAFAALYKRARHAKQQRFLLQEALDRFRQAAQAMPDGVIILGEQLAIEWLNTHAEQMLGLDQHRDIGTPIVNLVREPGFVTMMRQAPGSGSILLHSPLNAEQHLQVQAIPFGQGRLMVMARDITQIEKLATMRRDFVANVSHELKTPLTVISGAVETLLDGWTDLTEDEIRQLLTLSGDQSTRMQRLTKDLLTLSSLETNVLPGEDAVAVLPLLQEVLTEAEALSGGHHRISLINTGPAFVLGNADELRSAFSNLAANAVRYTPKDGTIELSWSANGMGTAQFQVTDSGIGIASAHISRLTERFYRVDRSRSRETGGTGLGLAIVKHVLERHGGYLRIRSEPGKGSEFAACLPKHRIAQTPPASSKSTHT